MDASSLALAVETRQKGRKVRFHREIENMTNRRITEDAFGKSESSKNSSLINVNLRNKKEKKQKIESGNEHNFDEDISVINQESVTSGMNAQESLKSVIQDTTLCHASSPNDFVTFASKLDNTEDPCDFEIPPVHISETVSPLTESRKHCLKSAGVSIKTGKFTRVEDSIILKNFNKFVQKYRISDPLELFGIGRYGKDYNLLQFIKAKHFYVKLGKGLSDRTLHSVYKRARLLLHPSRNSRKVDVYDVRAVKQLQSQIGKKWNLIGDALQKSGENCLQIYRWHENDISKGKWTIEEEKSLIEAIKKVSGSSNISCDYIKSISWEKVAAHVPTRNYSQCRMHWAIHLAWKENSLKQMWDKECSRKLLHILSKDWSVEDASMIDWEKIHECFEDVAPSPIFLQKRWLYLKSQIPEHKNITYKDIIKKLCIKYNLDSYDMHK